MPLKKSHEQHDDDGERALGVTLGRLPEGVDAIGDSFHPGHGGTTAGEDLQQQPERQHRRSRGQRWRTDDGRGMAMGKNSANRSDDNDEEQRADEQISRNEEGCAGILNAAHINERENSENEQAKPERCVAEV